MSLGRTLLRTTGAGLLLASTLISSGNGGPVDEVAAGPVPTGLLAGAAKASIAPRPADYGGMWEADPKAAAHSNRGS